MALAGGPGGVRGGARGGAERIASSMPGKVVALLVEEGDEVRAGQGVIVVEAMKMENTLPSPVAGTVRALPSEPGAAVAREAILAIITP